MFVERSSFQIISEAGNNSLVYLKLLNATPSLFKAIKYLMYHLMLQFLVAGMAA